MAWALNVDELFYLYMEVQSSDKVRVFKMNYLTK